MAQFFRTFERVNRDALNFRGAVETIVWAPGMKATFVLPRGRVGVPYHAQVEVQGGLGPYKFSESLFPANTGLVFDQETGVLSGIPTRAVNGTGLLVVISDQNDVKPLVLRGLTLVIEP